jgi:hypothetical protein
MIDELDSAKPKCRPILINRDLSNAIETGARQHTPTFVPVKLARISL